MKLANIVTTNKIDVPEDFNVVNSEKDIISGLPTLLVGYDYVSKNYPDFDITNPEIKTNLYWSFKRNEKRDNYEETLSWFIHKTYEDLTKDLVYVFVDPIQYRPRTLAKIVRKIYSLKEPITYRHKTMVYIYSEKFIFGIDLKLLNFIGFDARKILSKIKKLSHVFLCENEIIIEYKKIIETLDNKVRYTPYLYAIKNGQNNNTSDIHLP
jgi:hypothetical protein